jgi:hypothetical protein
LPPWVKEWDFFIHITLGSGRTRLGAVVRPASARVACAEMETAQLGKLKKSDATRFRAQADELASLMDNING